MATTYELIASTTLGASAAAMSFTSIPSTFTDLCLIVSARCDDSTASFGFENVNVKFNGSTTNFTVRQLRNLDGSVSSTSFSSGFIGDVPNSNATANTFGSLELYLPNYAGATNKSFSVTNVTESNASIGTDISMYLTAGLWSQTTAISSVEVYLSTDNFVANSSAYLFGITKA